MLTEYQHFDFRTQKYKLHTLTTTSQAIVQYIQNKKSKIFIPDAVNMNDISAMTALISPITNLASISEQLANTSRFVGDGIVVSFVVPLLVGSSVE